MNTSSSLNFANTCYISSEASTTQVLCYSASESLYAVSFIVILLLGVITLAITLLKK